MKTFIETERLILREILPADEAGLFELDRNPEVHKYLGREPVTNIEQTRKVIRMIRRQYLDNGIGRWAIIDKSTNDFIGWTGLKLVREKTNDHIDFYDLGYRIIQKYWGKGIATETALASLEYGFNTLATNEIYGMCEIENQGSKNVLEKSGLTSIETFDLEGTAHNWYRITRDEWRNKLPVRLNKS